MLKKKRFILLMAVLGIGLLLAMNFILSNREGDEKFLKPVSKIINQVEAEFDLDFIEILMQNRPDEPLTFSNLSIDSYHKYYLFDESGKLIFWSDFSHIPDFENIKAQENFRILQDREGIYFSKMRRFNRNEKGYILFQTYPLFNNREIQNEYLPSGFNKSVFGNDRLVISAEQRNDFVDVKGSKNEYLFSINFEQGYQAIGQTNNIPLMVFFFSLLFLILISGYDFVKTIWQKGKKIIAVFYASIILFSIRGFMLFFGFPQDYFVFSLFDSSKFASSLFNPSLGDLLLNVICLIIPFAMVLAILLGPSFTEKFYEITSKYKRWYFFVLAYFTSTVLLIGFYSLYINILSNAQWDLNILSIPSFDYFKGISLLLIFFGSAGYLLFTIIALSLVLENRPLSKVYALKILLVFSTPIVIGLSIFNWIYLLVYLTHLLFLISIISFELHKNIFRLGLNTFLTFFFGCLISAIVTGIAAHEVLLERQQQSKIRFGNQQLIENDVMAEFFLSDIMKRISEDIFIKNALTDPLQSKEPIERKIRRIHMTNYFDQYALRVKVFNASGDNVLQRTDEESLQDLRVNYVKSDYVTSVRDLYFIKGTEEIGSNQYFAFIPLYKDDVFSGTVYLELSQIRVLPGSVFPKLLMDQNYQASFNDRYYDFAVYQDGVLQYGVGVFNYRASDLHTSLDNSSLYSSGIYKKQHHHLGVKSDEKVVIVSSPTYSIYYILADISLFFLFYILLTLLSVGIYALLKGLNNFNFNYATKLQMYLNFAFFFPILIISAIILGLLASSYQDELHRQYFQRATLVKDNLSAIMEKQSAGVAEREDFFEEVNNLAGTANIEINVFDKTGYLMTSSQPNIFDKRVVTRYVNPLAMAELIERQNNLVLLEENIGKLNYKAVYSAIRSSDGQNVQAIIAIPFFESENELDILIADVLSNILNIFVLVFIIFLFVSYFVSKNLTFPFKLLTQKLKATDLENNEPMYWPSKDEIGMLVNEYNNMLFKLEASKNVLANTEKESAWREMAKQVAHEIKNPLTPMKLTLQHLLRLQAAGKLDDPQKLKKPVETLITQVDTLSDIATSFSTFAKMPLPKNDLMDFRSVVKSTLELFKNRERGTVTFEDYTENMPLQVVGDDQLFGRVISNLIINGIQAVEGRKKPVVNVYMRELNGKVIVEIKDNGKGIPDDLRDKIFIPNFSTKSEGSGLGLAIAKRGVETAGGDIWFETSVGLGTSFFLSFDLVPHK
ncbi:sensor histidine kinase [Mongoliibacter ruber]|uniref:histidine kinase n=1 Tax=Mongoliibacter ruber TaxID=1750599 RepID=A0A2T0WHM0_9BACT|nr:ATP-binding protein [Mongoliibacter ruber]PRY86208.1 phospho-acceptor domain-containing protein [Mongoliibacter ruber]